MGKPWYAAQGCGDRERSLIAYNMSTLRQSSTKVIVSTSVVFDWRYFSYDVNQVYLQSEGAIARDLYGKERPREAKYLGLDENELLRMLEPPYGVPEAGLFWRVALVLLVKEDLVMNSLTSDSVIFLQKDAGDPDGMLGAYVDNSCMVGKKRFQDLTTATFDKFQSEPQANRDVTYIGASMCTHP